MSDISNICTCGKPLTEVNAYGMFCEDFCGLDESIHIEKVLNPVIEKMGKTLERQAITGTPSDPIE